MTKVIQDTYPVYPRGSSTTTSDYLFGFTYYDDSEITIWVMPGTDRSHKVILPTTGYYTITRTGEGATPGGYITILSMTDTDIYMRNQLALDWPSNDWSTATFQNIAIQRTIEYSQPVTQPIGYSNSVTEEGDDHAVLEIQQLDDRVMAIEDLLIWAFSECTLTKYMIPVCDETGNFKFIDSHWKDDGIELSAYLPTKIYSSLWVQTTLDVLQKATLGSLEVLGTSLLRGAVTMESTLDVAGATTLQNTLSVAGATHLQSTLQVDGVATFHENVDCDKQITAQILKALNRIETTGITWVGDGFTTTKVKFSPYGAVPGNVLIFRTPAVPNSDYDLEILPGTVEGGGGGSGTVNVSASTIAMGGQPGEVIDSKLIQSESEQALISSYGLGTISTVNLYRPDSTDNPINAQKLACSTNLTSGVTTVLFNLDKYALQVNGISNVSVKRISLDVLELYLDAANMPELLLRSPSYDNGLTYWEGHDNKLSNQYLLSDSVAKIQDNKITSCTFSGAQRKKAVYTKVTQITGSATTVIDYTADNTYQITYAVSITSLSFSPALPSGASVMLIFIKSVEGALVTWPTTWKWSNGVAPDSSLFYVNRPNAIVVTNIEGAIEANIIYKHTQAFIATTYPTLLGDGRDHAVVSFYDATGDNIRYTDKGEIQNNKMLNLSILGIVRMRAIYCATQNISIVAGVLTIPVETTTRNVYVFTHTEDITSVVISIGQGLDTTAWRLKIIKKPGASTQTNIPLPAGVIAPANKKAMYVGTGISFSEFVSYGSNVVEYIGSSRSAA